MDNIPSNTEQASPFISQDDAVVPLLIFWGMYPRPEVPDLWRYHSLNMC